MPILREATLYRESQASEPGKPPLLTRGSKIRKPDKTLKGATMDVQTGKFWIQNLPDFFTNPVNEAFLEITVVSASRAGSKEAPLSYPFKFNIKVKDKSFSANIAGTEILTGVQIGSSGIEFRIGLSEIDKTDQAKLAMTRKFIQDNKIPEVANILLASASLPVNVEQIVGIFFNTVQFIDELNEDDLVWLERKKLDLRDGADNPLYEGWYALVTTPKDMKKEKLPLDLMVAGGELFTTYQSDTDNEPFRSQNYLTWKFLRTGP
jgi:hypothetical protein